MAKSRMLQTAERGASKSKTAPHEKYLEAFRIMLQTRIFEEKLASLYRGGLITGGVYLGKGQEAVSVACGLFLQKGDVFAPLIRDQPDDRLEPLSCGTTYLCSEAVRCADAMNIHRAARAPPAAEISISGDGSVVVVKLLASSAGREMICWPDPLAKAAAACATPEG